MKILFIYPEHYLNVGIPGGISILAAILKQHGHTVRVFDTAFLKVDPDFDQRYLHTATHGGSKDMDKAGLQIFKKTAYTIEDLVKNDPVVTYQEEFQRTIDSFSPDLIAISSMTSTFDFAMSLVRSIRHHALVAVGGVHATIATDDVLSQKEVDIACIGEGDDVFAELCNLMQAGKDHTAVRSMCFRMPDGSIKRNPLAPRVDLDQLPCPDWGLFDSRHLYRPFVGNIYKGSFYVQSRGCPQHCTYCINSTVAKMTSGSKDYFRLQRPGVTIAHLTELKERYGATWYKFADDSFLLPPLSHLEELASGLKLLGIQFGCSVMPNTITEEKVLLAKDMGCVAMSVGVESGNAGIRRKIKRNYNDEQLVKSLHMIQDHGIRLSTFNIIGFPGETRENVFETIELNRLIGTTASNVYILYPYPGTPIQIEHNIPVRDKEGKIPPVSRAKELRLSKMEPDELDGLQQTFNLYLNLPKSLWPVVRMAERSTEIGRSLFGILGTYSIAVMSEEVLDAIIITQVTSSQGQVTRFEKELKLPALLAGILALALDVAELKTVIASFREYAEKDMAGVKLA
jgi:radical SAM superfamily enzyme YgiQ (UPF0313 family)